MKTGYLRTALISGGLTAAFMASVGYAGYRYDQSNKALINTLEARNAAVTASNAKLRAGLAEAAQECRARGEGLSSLQDTAKAISEHSRAAESHARETRKRITELCACPKRR